VALEVVADQSTCPQKGDHPLAIGHRRGGGVAVLITYSRFGWPLRHRARPQQLAILLAQAVDEAILAALAGAGQGDAIAPGDRRRIAVARDAGAPNDVVAVLRPGDRQRLQAGEA